MKTVLSAAVLAAATVAATAAPAAAAKLYLRPIVLDTTTEIVVGLVNTCVGTATFDLSVRDGLTNTLLKRRKGSIPAGTGKAVAWHPAGANQGPIYGVLKIGCAGEATKLPLLGVTIRDFGTKIPIAFGCGDYFLGTTVEGSCI